MTQPTQEEIRGHAIEIASWPSIKKWELIAEIDLRTKALQAWHNTGDAGEETDEELYEIFREQLSVYDLDNLSKFELWKAGRESKR